MNAILRLPDLAEITGYTRAGDVERCLREQGIKVFRGKGGAPWTTLALVNAAGGIQAVADADTSYPVDAFK